MRIDNVMDLANYLESPSLDPHEISQELLHLTNGAVQLRLVPTLSRDVRSLYAVEIVPALAGVLAVRWTLGGSETWHYFDDLSTPPKLAATLIGTEWNEVYEEYSKLTCGPFARYLLVQRFDSQHPTTIEDYRRTAPAEHWNTSATGKALMWLYVDQTPRVPGVVLFMTNAHKRLSPEPIETTLTFPFITEEWEAAVAELTQRHTVLFEKFQKFQAQQRAKKEAGS